MSVCTFKRLPFICFGDEADEGDGGMLGTSMAAMAVQIVSTPIHNGCPALLQVEEAGKQAVKDSNLRFCCVLFFFFLWGFIYLVLLLLLLFNGIRKPGKPKTKYRVVFVVAVAWYCGI